MHNKMDEHQNRKHSDNETGFGRVAVAAILMEVSLIFSFLFLLFFPIPGDWPSSCILIPNSTILLCFAFLTFYFIQFGEQTTLNSDMRYYLYFNLSYITYDPTFYSPVCSYSMQSHCIWQLVRLFNLPNRRICRFLSNVRSGQVSCMVCVVLFEDTVVVLTRIYILGINMSCRNYTNKCVQVYLRVPTNCRSSIWLMV